MGADTDKALATSQVAKDIGIEQLHEQLIEIGMDEAGLRQELLGCGLVVGLGGRWEVRIDPDALAVAGAAAAVDGQPFESEEDLHLVLAQLDA